MMLPANIYIELELIASADVNKRCWMNVFKVFMFIIASNDVLVDMQCDEMTLILLLSMQNQLY